MPLNKLKFEKKNILKTSIFQIFSFSVAEKPKKEDDEQYFYLNGEFC